MQHMRTRLRNAGVVDSQGLKALKGGERILDAGLVTIRQRPASANGTIFLLLEDEWGFINVVVPSFLVDEFGEVVKFADGVLRVRLPAALRRYVARKGSICLDGVSLTVNQVDGDAFEVQLIPHTLGVTTLARLAPGARVNLEVDLIARYVERMLNPS